MENTDIENIKDSVAQEMKKEWESFLSKNTLHPLMSPRCDLLFKALSQAQGMMEHAKKDKSNPYFKSKYADLADVWNVCKEPLAQNGLAVIQNFRYENGLLTIITILGHESGQWIQSEMPVITSKGDPQSIGSAITYFRRYMLSSISGCAADEDDDGEKAQGRGSIPLEKISPSQVADLQKLIGNRKDLMNAVISQLHSKYGSSQLADMPIIMFSKARKWIESQLNEKKSHSHEEVA